MKDYTTFKNIVWCENDYGFDAETHMSIEQILSVDDMTFNMNNNVTFDMINEMLDVLRGIEGCDYEDYSLFNIREIIFSDVVDWYRDKFKDDMPINLQKEFAEILARNIVQIDPNTVCAPYTDKPVMKMNWNLNEMEIFKFKLN